MAYVQKETFRRSDDGFLKVIGFPYFGKISKDRKRFVANKLDIMVQTIDELIIMGFVSDFEKIVFDLVDNASGEITKIASKNYSNGPFKHFASDFVKSGKDIDKLSIIKAIISPKLPDELLKKFIEVIDFRNRLAHGKRFGEQSILSFDEIAETLDNVLNFI